MCLEDAGKGHQVMVAAVTAGIATPVRPGLEGTLRLAGQGCRTSGRLPLDAASCRPRARVETGLAGATFDGDATLELRTEPGRYYVTLCVGGGPVMLTVRVGDRVVTRDWHLLGHWCRDWPDPEQRLGFAADVPDGVISLGFHADPGLLYERGLNHEGGNGWVWRANPGQWERRVPEPWTIRSVHVEGWSG